MHDHRLSYIYLRKDSPLSACTKLQSSIGHHQFLPSHCKAKQNLVLISLNSCGMVGVGLGASLKGGNQIWSEKEYFYTFKL